LAGPSAIPTVHGTSGATIAVAAHADPRTLVGQARPRNGGVAGGTVASGDVTASSPAVPRQTDPRRRKPVRWGVLATGSIARTFVEDVQLMPDAEVVAVGSRTPAAAQAFADRFGIERAYGDWALLAADPEVDVVYVATPHSAHHPAAKLCLGAGRAVLCEKPLTLERATTQDLINTARAGGTFLMEAMWTRCNPTIRRVAELVADGAVGEITSVHASFGLAGPFPPDHRLRDPALGGGALLDLGIYPITIAHLLLGQPDTVRAWAALTPEGVDENTGMLLGYASGALASLTCGIAGGTPTTATIVGRRGRVDLPAPFFRPVRATLHRAGADPEVISTPLAGHGYVPQAAEVHRCLRQGLVESRLVPHAATLEVMAVMDEVRHQIGVVYPRIERSPDAVAGRTGG
jgi:predicted dehydrogenase